LVFRGYLSDDIIHSHGMIEEALTRFVEKAHRLDPTGMP
jgi:hypothetical protein